MEHLSKPIQINILKSNTHKGFIVSTTNDLKITMNIYFNHI